MRSRKARLKKEKKVRVWCVIVDVAEPFCLAGLACHAIYVSQTKTSKIVLDFFSSPSFPFLSSMPKSFRCRSHFPFHQFASDNKCHLNTFFFQRHMHIYMRREKPHVTESTWQSKISSKSVSPPQYTTIWLEILVFPPSFSATAINHFISKPMVFHCCDTHWRERAQQYIVPPYFFSRLSSFWWKWWHMPPLAPFFFVAPLFFFPLWSPLLYGGQRCSSIYGGTHMRAKGYMAARLRL